MTNDQANAKLPPIPHDPKPLLIVLTASLLAAGLVGEETLRLVNHPASVAASASDPADAKAVTESAAAQAEAWTKVCNDAARSALVDARPIAAPAGADETTAFVDAWNRWLLARDLVVGVSVAEKRFGDETRPRGELPELEEAERTLAALGEKLAGNPPPGSEPALARLKSRVDALAAEISARKAKRDEELADQKAQQLADEEWKAAESSYRRKEYRECLTLCDRLLDKQTRASDVARIQRLQGLSRFWAEVQKFDAAIETGAAALPSLGSGRAPDAEFGSKLDAADRFAKVNESRELSDEEKTEFNLWKGKIAELNKKFEKLKKDAEGIAKAEKLRSSPPDELSERLTQLKKILDEYPQILEDGRLEPDVRKGLADDVKSWLVSDLKKKTISSAAFPDPEMKEARSRKQDIGYLRGYFTEAKDASGRPGYIFAMSRSAGGGFHLKGDFELEPGGPIPQRLADRYNAAMKRLCASPGEKESWETFAQTCDQLQKDIDEYYKRMPDEANKLSFQAEAELARNLLDNHWVTLKKLFG